MRKLFLALVLLVTPLTSAPGLAQTEPFIGQTSYFPYTFCPRSWVEANGQLLPLAENTALFSLLGTNYGGDGRTTFGVPDFRQDGQDYTIGRWCIALVGIFPSRN